MNQLLRYLRAASPKPAPVEVPDRELLARFARKRDSDAFSLLVSRHGAAVWAACQRLLDREQDSEDAFQAVFLTLARKAAAVSGDCLAAWLHSVARRIAANIRREQQRRTTTQDAARVPEARTAELSWQEGLAILDEELARLPERYRAVLIACCLNGQSRDEAARQLSYTENQVKGLLERGRELLRLRLARRGFDLGALVLAATVASGAVAIPAVATEVAVRVAQGLSVTGAVSSVAIAHSGKVVSAMLVQKAKALAAGLLVVAIATGRAFTQPAAEGTEPVPGKKGNVEPGHAFAPRGGMAITDDPFKGPSKPLQPGKVPGPLTPRLPPDFNPEHPGFNPGKGPPTTELKRQPTLPKGPLTPDVVDPKLLREPGNRFEVEVIGRTDGVCSGTDLYFYDSDLGTAAVHAGLVKNGERAVITVTVVKCPKNGEGSTQNGVKSHRWDEARPTDTALLLQRLPTKKPVAKEPEGLTIDQAILAKADQKVKVLFEIGSVEWENLAGNDPKDPTVQGQEWRMITFHPKRLLEDGRRFQVYLTGAAVTPVFRLALVKLNNSEGTDYFKGKTIRVTGHVEALREADHQGVAFRIIVSNLDDLEVVK